MILVKFSPPPVVTIAAIVAAVPLRKQKNISQKYVLIDLFSGIATVTMSDAIYM